MIHTASRAAASIVVAGLTSLITMEAARTEDIPFPRSAFQAGEHHLVVQWCDTREAMASVVDLESTAGESAAGARWDELVNQGICHWIPPQFPTTATLLDRIHFVYVVGIDPERGGDERQAIVEVWLAAVDGIPDRPVYITQAAWTPEEI